MSIVAVTHESLWLVARGTKVIPVASIGREDRARALADSHFQRSAEDEG